MVDRTAGPYRGRMVDTTQTGSIRVQTTVASVATPAYITLRLEGVGRYITSQLSSDLTIAYLLVNQYYLLTVRFIDPDTRQPSPRIYSNYVQATNPVNSLAVELNNVAYGGGGGGGSGSSRVSAGILAGGVL